VRETTFRPDTRIGNKEVARYFDCSLHTAQRRMAAARAHEGKPPRTKVKVSSFNAANATAGWRIQTEPAA
jgi:hypothetical protein